MSILQREGNTVTETGMAGPARLDEPTAAVVGEESIAVCYWFYVKKCGECACPAAAVAWLVIKMRCVRFVMLR